MIDQHRAAFEYDWRTRFHLPLTAIGRAMSYGEAFRMTGLLAGDPGSQVGAALAEWAYPLSREAIALVDLYDLQHTSKAKRKPKPYPRPMPERTVRRHQPDATMTQADVIAALRMAGHTKALPGTKDAPHWRDACGRLHDERGRFVAG